MNRAISLPLKGAAWLLLVLALPFANAQDMNKTAPQTFVSEASAAGVAEIEAGKMALEKSTAADVKVFAKQMIDDHGKVNAELRSLAERKKLEVEDDASLTDKAKATLLDLRDASFDPAYANNQVAAHESRGTLHPGRRQPDRPGTAGLRQDPSAGPEASPGDGPRTGQGAPIQVTPRGRSLARHEFQPVVAGTGLHPADARPGLGLPAPAAGQHVVHLPAVRPGHRPGRAACLAQWPGGHQRLVRTPRRGGPADLAVHRRPQAAPAAALAGLDRRLAAGRTGPARLYPRPDPGRAFPVRPGLGLALLVAAILAPTDPVLASDIQVNHAGDDDRLRYAVSGEAGLNDGIAFPSSSPPCC